MKVNVKRLNKDSVLPTQGSKYSAGYDLYSTKDETILPHCTEKIGTGLAFQPDEKCFGAIFAKSGLATKLGIRPANCVGVADMDYTGEYIVALHNDSCDPVSIKKDDRIAQLVFLPYIDAEFNEVKELNDTERGNGGFGSTGK
jgi:dUTP pyrophosphatase